MPRIMSLFGIALALTFTACTPTLADKPTANSTPANFTGSWKGSWRGQQRSGDLDFALADNGKGLGGTVTGTNAPAFTPDNALRKIESLTVKGNDLSLAATGVDGHVMSATLTLDKTGKRMTGWATNNGYSYWFDVSRQE